MSTYAASQVLDENKARSTSPDTAKSATATPALNSYTLQAKLDSQYLRKLAVSLLPRERGDIRTIRGPAHPPYKQRSAEIGREGACVKPDDCETSM